MAYVFDKNGYPINRNGKPRKTFCGFRVNKIQLRLNSPHIMKGQKLNGFILKLRRRYENY